jgi:carbonic anhydrase/acetyltransferase-like protein (isoleucine patch superfamily)
MTPFEPLIFALDGKKPKIHKTAFIAPGAVVAGDVEIGAEASIWYGCVLRGDINKIVVGAGSNIQDGSIVHADAADLGGAPTVVGENALIGHRCMLHGATIEDGAFIGMCATILEGAVVKAGAMLAAGAFLTPHKVVPSGEIWAGSPARKFRDLRRDEDVDGLSGAAYYVGYAKRHRAALEALRSD